VSVEIGLLYSRIRRDEKLLLSELRDRGHEVRKVDVRDTTFGVGAAGDSTAVGDAGDDTENETTDAGDDTEEATDATSALAGCDVVLDRCLATSRSMYTTRFAEAYDLPVVNDPATARVCADKVETSLALAEAGIPTPETRVAFDTESALAAVESFGYPCVLKPVVGSWGRLMAKLEGRAAAEAVLEHKATLGHYEHKVFYVQNFVEKPGRDLRVLVCGTEPVAAMSRSGDHWLTNAKQGADTAAFELDDRAAELATAAAEAVGGGLLGVDLMEVGAAEDADAVDSDADPAGSDADPADSDADPADSDADAETESRYTVHEVNHTVEFKALNDAVGRDVPATVVDWLETTHGAADEAGDTDETGDADETGDTDDTREVIAE